MRKGRGVARKLGGEHVETTVSGQPDSLITPGLYPKSYLKISFTTRELINVNISRRSSLAGTTAARLPALKPSRGRPHRRARESLDFEFVKARIDPRMVAQEQAERWGE